MSKDLINTNRLKSLRKGSSKGLFNILYGTTDTEEEAQEAVETARDYGFRAKYNFHEIGDSNGRHYFIELVQAI